MLLYAVLCFACTYIGPPSLLTPAAELGPTPSKLFRFSAAPLPVAPPGPSPPSRGVPPQAAWTPL